MSQPGWYPHPSNPNLMTEWDGQGWTGQTVSASEVPNQANMGPAGQGEITGTYGQPFYTGWQEFGGAQGWTDEQQAVYGSIVSELKEIRKAVKLLAFFLVILPIVVGGIAILLAAAGASNKL